MITIINTRAGWPCSQGATLLADATSPGRGLLPDLHATIYVCETHCVDAENAIEAAGYRPEVVPAPPSHHADPWPCGHITAFSQDAATALTTQKEPQ